MNKGSFQENNIRTIECGRKGGLNNAAKGNLRLAGIKSGQSRRSKALKKRSNSKR